MAASPEAIAAKLAEIISAKGPSAITDDPYGTYQEILKSKTADRKTAGALLHVLVSSVPELAAKNQDAEELSVAVQNECCLSKAMADRMAEVLSLLYSADNMDGRKEMDGDDLPGSSPRSSVCPGMALPNGILGAAPMTAATALT